MPLIRWKTLSSRDVLREKWIRLRADRVEIAPGKILDPYYVIEDHEWAHVVAFNANHEVLLVRQYRYACADFSWEFPGGMTEPGEDLLAAAQREFLEETGATAPHWRHLASLHPNSARQTNHIHAYIAEGAVISALPQLDHGESLESAWFSVPAVLDLIRRGEFHEASHIALFYLTLDELGLLTHRAP